MTLAFSTKSNMWTTEYSFEPDCFAVTDGRMFAFNEIADSGDEVQSKLWLHDQTNFRNSFYGESYPSKISVVSNENPSSTKAYESVSLETSYSDWSMRAETVEQEGSTSDFSKKENDQYASIPKDNRVTASNLTYIGTCAGDQLIMDSLVQSRRIRMSTFSGRFALGALCFRNKAEGTDGVLEDAVDGAVAAIDQQARRVGILDKSEDQLSQYIRVASLSGPDIILDSVSDGFDLDPATSPENGDFYTAQNQVEIWVASADSGESMKGDYIVVDLETPSGPDNFELYAINVDQHSVNLDHSLGQNN